MIRQLSSVFSSAHDSVTFYVFPNINLDAKVMLKTKYHKNYSFVNVPLMKSLQEFAYGDHWAFSGL